MVVVGRDRQNVGAARLGDGHVDDRVARCEPRIGREVDGAVDVLVEAEAVLEVVVVHKGVQRRWGRGGRGGGRGNGRLDANACGVDRVYARVGRVRAAREKVDIVVKILVCAAERGRVVPPLRRPQVVECGRGQPTVVHVRDGRVAGRLARGVWAVVVERNVGRLGQAARTTGSCSAVVAGDDALALGRLRRAVRRGGRFVGERRAGVHLARREWRRRGRWRRSRKPRNAVADAVKPRGRRWAAVAV